MGTRPDRMGETPAMAQGSSRILLLTGRPGAEDDLRPLAGRLRGLGHEVRALLAGREPAGLPPWPDLAEVPGLASPWLLPWAVRRLGRGLDGWRPDLIHAVQADVADVAVALAERWRVPYVLTVDEFLAPGEGVRLARRWCRRLVATSRELADELVGDLGIPAPLVATVHPGIEARDDDPATEDDGEPDDAPRPTVAVVGAAGPLSASSGFTTFLGAARRVLDAGIDAEFVIAGQGEDEDEGDLRRRVDRLRIADRVTFAGRLAVDGSFWGVLDLFCLTSTVPTTGYALAVAMAHGVPAVASDVPGLRELVEHEVTGLRVPPDDSQALARAVLDLLADEPRARALGAAGRDRILADFDPDREAAELSALYGAALEPPASSPLLNAPSPGGAGS